MPQHLHKPLKFLLSKVRVVIVNLRIPSRVQHNKHICEITVIESWWVVLLVSRFIRLKRHDYPARLLRGWFHPKSPGEISHLWDWDRVALNHSVANWETWFRFNCFGECKFFLQIWSHMWHIPRQFCQKPSHHRVLQLLERHRQSPLLQFWKLRHYHLSSQEWVDV